MTAGGEVDAGVQIPSLPAGWREANNNCEAQAQNSSLPAHEVLRGSDSREHCCSV